MARRRSPAEEHLDRLMEIATAAAIAGTPRFPNVSSFHAVDPDDRSGIAEAARERRPIVLIYPDGETCWLTPERVDNATVHSVPSGRSARIASSAREGWAIVLAYPDGEDRVLLSDRPYVPRERDMPEHWYNYGPEPGPWPPCEHCAPRLFAC